MPLSFYALGCLLVAVRELLSWGQEFGFFTSVSGAHMGRCFVGHLLKAKGMNDGIIFKSCLSPPLRGNATGWHMPALSWEGSYGSLNASGHQWKADFIRGIGCWRMVEEQPGNWHLPHLQAWYHHHGGMCRCGCHRLVVAFFRT